MNSFCFLFLFLKAVLLHWSHCRPCQAFGLTNAARKVFLSRARSLGRTPALQLYAAPPIEELTSAITTMPIAAANFWEYLDSVTDFLEKVLETVTGNPAVVSVSVLIIILNSSLNGIKSELKADAKELSSKLELSISALSSNLDLTKSELKADAKELKSELKADAKELKSELKADAKELSSKLELSISALSSKLDLTKSELTSKLDKDVILIRSEMNEMKNDIKAAIAEQGLKIKEDITLLRSDVNAIASKVDNHDDKNKVFREKLQFEFEQFKRVMEHEKKSQGQGQEKNINKKENKDEENNRETY